MSIFSPRPARNAATPDERRQEREREEAYREELLAEDARRLARYDEAVRLLRRCYRVDNCDDAMELERYLESFLADEPAQRGEGGAG